MTQERKGNARQEISLKGRLASNASKSPLGPSERVHWLTPLSSERFTVPLSRNKAYNWRDVNLSCRSRTARYRICYYREGTLLGRRGGPGRSPTKPPCGTLDLTSPYLSLRTNTRSVRGLGRGSMAEAQARVATMASESNECCDGSNQPGEATTQ